MKTKLMNDLFKFGVLAAIVAAAMPELAMAQGGAGMTGLVNDIAKEQLPILPRAISIVCYIGGSFMMVSGALKLKKHAENPAGEPMAKGVAALLTGGAITSVPALTKVIQETTTLNDGDAGAKFNNLAVTF